MTQRAAARAPSDLVHEPIPLETIQSDTARHFAVSAAAKAAMQILQLATLVALARLLAPSDFGVLAMVMSAIGVAELLRDLGLSHATVRAEQLTHGQLNTLFWINATLGAVLWLACIAVAPALASLLSDARVAPVTAVVGMNFLLNGLAAQHLALLRRRLRFAVIARINLSAVLLGSLTALALAALGAAYWALVAAALVGSAANALGAWRCSGWRPGAPAWDPAARPLLSFGGYLVGFGLLTYAAQHAHIVLIGRFFGAAAAGLYVRASTLLTQPMGYALEPLRLILPATLSRLQADPDGFRRNYLGALGPLLLGAAPFGAWLVVAADDVVHLLLGAQWTGTARVLAWLALSAVPQAINITSGWLYLARGDARAMMRWGVVGWTVVIGLMLSGLYWGIDGVAAMYSLSMFLIAVPCMHYACRGTQITLGDIWAQTWRPMAGAALAALPLAVVAHLARDWHTLPRLAAGSAVFAMTYLALMIGVFGERDRIVGLYTLLRRKLGSAR
ncbi:lipopolysaccharide biosynthesis protein [Fontimonas sp. SYSU GA230001]|uniref:lipopolysaccharide biosynthesis protein n=1 Tax=Fontimonas sp. SYSU GA230001 TaxID=3142450 RepID=UPI0032B49491